MSTYWVTGKADAPVPSPLPIPTKPVRRAAVLPIMQEVAPKATSTPSHFSRSPSLGPKPDEWPQAKQQLQKFSTLSPVDHSVPPGGAVRRNRRNTLPKPPDPAKLIPQTPLTKTRRHTEPGSPAQVFLIGQQSLQLLRSNSSSSLAQKDSKFWQQSQSLCNSPPLYLSQKESEPLQETPPRCLLMGQDLNTADLNLKDVCTAASIRMCPSPNPSSVACQEMEQFAMQAVKSAHHLEENARQAKQLAEWANNILHHLKTGAPVPPLGAGPNEMETSGLRSVLMGTPVDTILPEDDVVSS